jgi:hypothetical protein
MMIWLTIAVCTPPPNTGLPGKDGQDGTPGMAGKDGEDGSPGKDGVAGIFSHLQVQIMTSNILILPSHTVHLFVTDILCLCNR